MFLLRISAGLCCVALSGCSESHDSRADGGSVDLDGPPPVIDERGCRPDADFLLGGGRSAAECRGECSFELALSSLIALGDGSCIGYRGNLTVRDERGQVLYGVRADLLEAAWDRAASVASSLRQEPLAAVYGCPDCGEGSNAWVQTAPDAESPRQHTYPFRAPPQVLAPAHALIQSLIRQLQSCNGADIENCSRGTP